MPILIHFYKHKSLHFAGLHGVLHGGAGTLPCNPGGVRRGFSPPRFEKGLTRKCSWKCVAIFFVVLAVILSAALAYITGKKILKNNLSMMFNLIFMYNILLIL